MYHPGLCHFHAVTGHQALGIIGNYRLIIISFTLASMILSNSGSAPGIIGH
jgi:hypothetical protein